MLQKENVGKPAIVKTHSQEGVDDRPKMAKIVLLLAKTWSKLD